MQRELKISENKLLLKKLKEKYQGKGGCFNELSKHSKDKEIKFVLKSLYQLDKFQKYHPIFKIILALIFVVLGIVGILLPVLPGVIFLVAGWAVFSKRVTKYLHKATYKYIYWKQKKLTKKTKIRFFKLKHINL